MSRRFIRAVVLLPGTVLVLVPGILIWATHGTDYAAAPVSMSQITLWLGSVVALIGAVFCIWTMRLFAAAGDGTPAPWDPVRKLVVTGPYRYVRNPMITGVLFILAAETLVCRSMALLGWAVLFLVANLIYLPRREEPELEKRYGAEYRLYKLNVPRWLPRLRPWRGLDAPRPGG